MDDLELVQRCASKDRVALDEFLARYSRLIYHYLYGVLRSRSLEFAREEVNDLFQEFFIFLSKEDFKKLKSYKAKNNCKLASWLRVISVNFAIDYLRKQRAVSSLDAEDSSGSSLKDFLADDSVLAPEAAVKTEEAQRLKECISQLGLDDKYFLELHFNHEVGLEELSRHLNISRPALDMRKMRLIERLRDCFRKHGF